jgi:hypothetical protein
MSRRAPHLRTLLCALCATAASLLAAGCLTPAPRLDTAPTLDDAAVRKTSGLRFIDLGDAWVRVRVVSSLAGLRTSA